MTRRRETADDRAPQRTAFAAALFHVMELKGMSQRDLAEMVGLTHTALTGWRNLDHEPPPTTVFAVEQALELPPGFLSINLGYLPPEARTATFPDEAVLAAIEADPRLDERGRRMLKLIYTELREPPPRRLRGQ